MRLVVGPLPASVYWRRRAMVLGAVTLVVAMIVYSCSQSGKTAASPPPTPEASPAPTPEGVVAPVDVVTPSPTPSAAAPVGPVDPQECTDAEFLVTAVPAKTTVAAGAELRIDLFIKNTSQRSCNRDIGPDQQELYIVLGTQRIWSSDHCDPPTGSEPRTFPPGHERSYYVIWNGHSSISCSTTDRRTPNGPAPEPGEYQLFGRVGTDLSEPITLTLT